MPARTVIKRRQPANKNKVEQGKSKKITKNNNPKKRRSESSEEDVELNSKMEE